MQLARHLSVTYMAFAVNIGVSDCDVTVVFQQAYKRTIKREDANVSTAHGLNVGEKTKKTSMF
jgi:hypothetical protein